MDTRWIGRFVERRPLQMRERLHVVACKDATTGEPRLVLTERPGEGIVQRIAEAHRRVDHPVIPRVVEVESHPEGHIVVLASDAAVDGDAALETLTRAGRPIPFSAGIGMASEIMDAVAACHAADTCIGTFSWKNILFSREGRPWLLGIADSLHAHSRSAYGIYRAPGHEGGGTPTPHGDVYAFILMLRATLGQVTQQPELYAQAQRGEVPDDPVYAQKYWAVQERMMIPGHPRAFRSMGDAKDAIIDMWGTTPDPVAGRALVAEAVITIVARQKDDLVPAELGGGRYRVSRTVGSDETCVVFLAWDSEVEQEVAIKVPLAPPDPSRKAPLQRELRILRSVHHPNLVAGFDIIDSPAGPVLVKEYVEGPLWDPRNVDAQVVLGWLADLADGLAVLHRHGIAHRDVKPNNIVISERGPVLVDFGFATDSETSAGPDWVGRRGHRYLAPEQQHGEGGPASDVHALAYVAVEALAGTTFKDREAVIAAVHGSPGIPDALEGMLHRALSPEPAGRPNADELSVAFRRARPSRVKDLSIGPDANWFELEREHVDLSRRGPLRRILLRLVDAHHETRGVRVELDDIVEAGWSDERMRPESAWNRAYVAIATLRKIGLKDAILTSEGGYLLDPAMTVRRATANS